MAPSGCGCRPFCGDNVVLDGSLFVIAHIVCCFVCFVFFVVFLVLFLGLQSSQLGKEDSELIASLQMYASFCVCASLFVCVLVLKKVNGTCKLVSGKYWMNCQMLKFKSDNQDIRYVSYTYLCTLWCRTNLPCNVSLKYSVYKKKRKLNIMFRNLGIFKVKHLKLKGYID